MIVEALNSYVSAFYKPLNKSTGSAEEPQKPGNSKSIITGAIDRDFYQAVPSSLDTDHIRLANDLRNGWIWPANAEQCPQSWILGRTFLDKTAPHQVHLLSNL
jgi:hypothetical protein